MNPGSAALILILLLAACQPLTGSHVTPTPEALPPTSLPEQVPTVPISTDIRLPSVYATIKIAYTSQEQLWIWENNHAISITHANLDTTLAISKSGEQIAFLRDGQLLVIDSNGANEHVLIPAQQMTSLSPQNPARLLNFSWVPGRPLLLVTTLQDSGAGPQPNQDLYLLHTDTGEMVTVFTAGQGGTAYPSLDGAWLAILSPERARLLKSDGSDERTLLTYSPYQSGYTPYIPKPYWAADSQSFLLETRSEDSATTWQIPVAGEAVLLIPSTSHGLFFSPDLSKYAYVLDDGMLDSPIELHIADLDGTNDSVYAQAIHEDYTGLGFLGWAPDSKSFLFTEPNRDPQWMKFGEMEAQTVPIPTVEPFRAMKIIWLDANAFVVIIRSPSGIWLSVPGQESLQVADFPEGELPASDLARGFDIFATNGFLP